MPVSVSWYDDLHRAVFQRYEGRWTWEDLSHAAQQTRALADSVPYTVILFIDMSRASQLPQGNVLSNGRAAFNMMPTNLTHIIVTMQSQIIEVFADLVIKMLPHWRNRVKFVKTVEEAQKLMADVIAVNTRK